METLYKTAKPQELERAEYYQIRLVHELLQGQTVYFVREKHGWYDDRQKRAVHNITTLDPEQGFATYEEAKQRYDQHLHHRASEGFVHSFSIDPLRDPPFIYRLLKER